MRNRSTGDGPGDANLLTKTLQAVAVLLELDGGRMARIRLLKLLYIVDRELLADVARPLTGARVVAMKYGPVLSQVYDLIKGEAARAGVWVDTFIPRVTRSRYRAIQVAASYPARNSKSWLRSTDATEITTNGSYPRPHTRSTSG